MSDDNVEYLVVDHDSPAYCVVDSVNCFLQNYGLVFEKVHDEAYENGDGRMWWTIKELTNEE